MVNHKKDMLRASYLTKIHLVGMPVGFHLGAPHNRFLKIKYGLVAQLVRVPPCHGGCRGFESRQGRSQRVATVP